MKKLIALAVLLLTSPALADPSWFYVDPPTQEYFVGPPGTGFLKICKNDDGNDTKNMRVPMGTSFDDQGPLGTRSGEPDMWLLSVVTTKSTTFKPGQKCAVVPARVVPVSPPLAHPELKSVLRFEKDDKRNFEIAAPDDPDAPLPDLAPWNTSYPSLNATANSDFK
jgi:hypothetical protein